MRTFFILVFFYFSLQCVANQQDSLINRIFNLAYNQEYALADSLLQMNKANIDQLNFTVMDIDMSYWKNVTGTNHPEYQAFEETLKKYSLTHIESLKQKITRLITLSYQLRYELKRYHLLSAFITQKNTRNIFEELLKSNAVKKANQEELLELYRSMFTYFDNYFNFFGSQEKKRVRQEALINMRNLANSEIEMVRTLSSYFLAKTYLKYEKTPAKGIPYFQYLCKKYPGNIKFPEYLNECKKGLGK